MKVYWKGEGWQVIEGGLAGQVKACSLRSAPHYLDKFKNPRYGSTYLELTYPTHYVIYKGGDKMGVYFRTVRRATIQVGTGSRIPIVPEKPLMDKRIIDALLAGNATHIKVELDFGNDSATYSFSAKGFRTAYAKLKVCAK
jgi:hypothetical protein